MLCVNYKNKQIKSLQIDIEKNFLYQQKLFVYAGFEETNSSYYNVKFNFNYLIVICQNYQTYFVIDDSSQIKIFIKFLKQIFVTNINSLLISNVKNFFSFLDLDVLCSIELSQQSEMIQTIKTNIKNIITYINIIDIEHQLNEDLKNIINIQKSVLLKLNLLLQNINLKLLFNPNQHLLFNNFYNYVLFLISKNKLCIDTQQKNLIYGTKYSLHNKYISQCMYVNKNTLRPKTFGWYQINQIVKKGCDGLKVQKNDNLLVSFDYNHYFLSLISNLIDKKIEGDIYQYLVQQEIIKSSKTRKIIKNNTFKLFFSNKLFQIQQSNQFMKKVKQFAENIYNEYNYYGYVLSPISQKHIPFNNKENTNKALYLNYYLMVLQTQINIYTMFMLLRKMHNLEFKILCYKYDEFIIEIPRKQLLQHCQQLYDIINFNNIFKTKIYVGSQLKNMKKI